MSTPLERLDAPLCHRVHDVPVDAPDGRLDRAQRTRIRSLSTMQKEALVTSARTGDTWRLASDEGPYLDGVDVAPPPLAFKLAGMVCSYANEILALADRRDVEIDDLTLVLDNFYAIRGSLLQGTMVGEALPPDLEAVAESDADEGTLRDLVEDAVTLSPVHGLMAGEHPSRFGLTHNGEAVATGDVAGLEGPRLPDPAGTFEELRLPSDEQDPPLVRHTGRTTEPFPDADETYTDKDAAGYSDEQDRIIHLRGTCTLREDGLKHVEQKTYSPRASVFEFLSEEPEGHGGRGRAPDALTYVAAGIGFCFMTQLGRYASVVDEELSGYRIVQDTHFSPGGATAGTGRQGEAEPVETHVFLDTPADEEFARDAVDVSERTCYMHAFCRTDLAPEIDVTSR